MGMIDDRELWWSRKGHDMQPVVANWDEARQYHLNSHCESCGAVWAQRGGRPGWCPECGSNATNRLEDDWDDLDNPWFDDDLDVDDIEAARITNF